MENEPTSEDRRSIIAIKRSMLAALYKIKRTANINKWAWITVPLFNVLVINGLLVLLGVDVTGLSLLALLIVVTMLAISFSTRALAAWIVENTTKNDNELIRLEAQLQEILTRAKSLQK